MRSSDVDILMVPGWTGSGPGPDHWQTRWATRLKTARRVEQDDWDRVDKAKWTGRLVEAVGAARRPVVLVAHACGVPTVVHAAPRLPGVVGAFLVAPPSEPACAARHGMDPAFTPFPRVSLPFASVLVASRNDEQCPFSTAEQFAAAWGSALIDAGEAGHLDTASGYGPWPDGAMRLGLFLQQLGPAP